MPATQPKYECETPASQTATHRHRASHRKLGRWRPLVFAIVQSGHTRPCPPPRLSWRLRAFLPPRAAASPRAVASHWRRAPNELPQRRLKDAVDREAVKLFFAERCSDFPIDVHGSSAQPAVQRTHGCRSFIILPSSNVKSAPRSRGANASFAISLLAPTV